MEVPKSYRQRCQQLLRHMRVHCDLMTKHKNSSYVFAKRARTTKKGVETLQDVSFLFQKGHCQHQRNGFLHVELAGVHQSNRMILLKKKDGERNLHFPSCPPKVQAGLRETRHAEWKKWMSFDAGVVFLTDEEARQLTEACCEIYPMQWIEEVKNAHLRRDHDYVFLYMQSIRVDCLVEETSRQRRDFAQSLQLVMWIHTLSFAVGVHRLMSPFTHAVSL